MNLTTYFAAYVVAMHECEQAVTSRARHGLGGSMGPHFGILVDQDQWARHYQKRTRQQRAFYKRTFNLLAALDGLPEDEYA